ncbi:hypothetical protein ACFLWO_02155 [Chloroflexota bacterium]
MRGSNIGNARSAAELVMASINNGAAGFTFTVSGTTLAILDEINKNRFAEVGYYPLVPNVSEMVRIAGKAGGIPGLAKEMAMEVVSCLDRRLLLNFVKGVLLNDRGSLFKSYLAYEYHRIRRIIKKENGGHLSSILLHEVVTDMALALDMEWLFRAHIRFMTELGIKPGFETRNLPYMVKQFKKWQIDTSGMVIEASFNAVGFQMSPSKASCEEALAYVQNAEVIAISVLAAGYLKLSDAFDYISTLKNLSGVAIGVSSEQQAVSTFLLGRQAFT